MKYSLILISIALIFCNHSFAQQHKDSLKYLYQNQAIYRYGNHFIKGNERLDFDELQVEFSFSDLGQIGYDRAKKLRTISKIFRYASLISTVAITPFIGNNNKNGAYILLGVNIGLGAGSALYSNLSNQSLDRALWQRNKDLLFPEQQ